MYGYDWEWCEDWYEDHVYDKGYRQGDLTKPTPRKYRVAKGGLTWSPCADPDPRARSGAMRAGGTLAPPRPPAPTAPPLSTACAQRRARPPLRLPPSKFRSVARSAVRAAHPAWRRG